MKAEEQTTWMLNRKGKFTASEIWKLFTEPRTKADKEAGKFSQTAETYITEKAVEMAFGYRPKFTSKEMEHGIINEPAGFSAFLDFVDLQGWEYCPQEFFAIDENSGASPDGICKVDGKITAVVDVKCPQPLTFFGLRAEGDSLEVEAKYFYQLQMQMLATGADEGYLAYYLAEEFGNTFTGEVEATFDLPIKSRLIIQKIPKDLSVQTEMTDKIGRAVMRRDEIVKSFVKL
jgi:hypothetical protein